MTNPYVPPSAAFQGASGCHREGNLLVLADGAILPPMCPVTCRPKGEGEDGMQPISLRWTPPWVYAFGILAVLPLFVMMAIMTKKGTVYGYLSPRIVRRTRMRKWGAAAMFVGGLALFITAMFVPGMFMPGVTGLMMAMGAIFVFYLASPLQATDYRNGTFLVADRPQRFLKMIPSAGSPSDAPADSSPAPLSAGS